MKVVKELNVSASAYFDCLQRYLLKDLKRTVDRKLKLNDLVEGYEFEKSYSLKNKVFVSKQVLQEMSYGEAYCLSFTVPKGRQSISHHIEELGENKIRVTYEEKVSSSSLLTNFRKLTSKRKSKKRMVHILEQMETEIILKTEN